MHEETSSARVPSTIQITVRWGASVLMAKRISPPKSMPLTGGVGRLELGANGLELVAGRERIQVVRGKRTKTVVDDVEIVIDATEDKLPMLAFPPVFEKRYAAADAGALLVHAGIFGLAFLTYAPLSHAETDVEDLRRSFDKTEVRSIPLTVDSSFNDEVGPGVSVMPRPRPEAGPAKRGPVWSKPAPVNEPTSIDEARTFGMIGLLAAADKDAASPWADATYSGDAFGEPSVWGSSDGAGDWKGVIGLSGIGEGGGHGGLPIALGTLATVGDGSGSAIERRLTGHRSKTPRFCGSGRCGARFEGRLPPEIIQRIVRQNHGRFRQCFVNTQRGGASDARVSVRFVIGRDGSVGNASATSDREDGLATCVARAFYGMSFPQPEGGVVTVTYPLVFTSDG
jgi:hypothetical protein